MDFESSFLGAALTVMVWVTLGMLVLMVITPLERRLVAGTALLLAGLFLLSQPDVEIPVTVAGAGAWATGLTIFTRAGLQWNGDSASRAGPLAALVVLPTAFLGSILLVGVVVSAVAAPLRLILRLLGS
jgi:hypothetical protein